jgi:hypothetical protein
MVDHAFFIRRGLNLRQSSIVPNFRLSSLDLCLLRYCSRAGLIELHLKVVLRGLPDAYLICGYKTPIL